MSDTEPGMLQRLGDESLVDRTLRRRREAFLAYFTTSRANNGGTEAVNGIIELNRRLARGFRNRLNYRLRAHRRRRPHAVSVGLSPRHCS